MSIRVEDIAKSWEGFEALKGVSLEVAAGELVALLGPSGSGKTTLLRVIGGLEVPDRGRVFLHAEDATEQHVQKRGVGFVFQHYALFRHLDVFENVAFGLRVKPKHIRPSESEIRKKVEELLALVHLGPYGHRRPDELSGGQRQRVALARALAVEPRFLLLDEPFAALDARVRQELRRFVRGLHERLGITTLIVTHDQEEALELADRVVVLKEGRIEQVASPADLWAAPASPFIFDFLGRGPLFEGTVRGGRLLAEGLDLPAPGVGEGLRGVVGVDAATVSLERAEAGARVRRSQPFRDLQRVDLELPGGRVVRLELPGDRVVPEAGATVRLAAHRTWAWPAVPGHG
jgi:sulfate transport system ATP-binding protein